MPDPAREANGAPRWVKVSAIIAVVGVALFLVVLVIGSGHGPGRHTPGGGSEPTPDTGASHTGPPPGLEHGDE